MFLEHPLLVTEGITSHPCNQLQKTHLKIFFTFVSELRSDERKVAQKAKVQEQLAK